MRKNYIAVRVSKFGETVREVVLSKGATVEDAIVLAGVMADGCSIQINNGKKVALDTTIKQDTILIIVPEIKTTFGEWFREKVREAIEKRSYRNWIGF